MTGQAAEELGEYLTAARLGLKKWDLFLNLSLAYRHRHELTLAADAFATAESLDPEQMIAGYLGSTDQFDEAIGDYAVAYADQIERDFETFVKAVRSARLKSDLSPSRLATALR